MVELRRVTITRERVARRACERSELGTAPKREGSARLEPAHGWPVRGRRDAAELRDHRNNAPRLRDQILVPDFESALAERCGLLMRLVEVLLPHRERLRERPAAARRQNAERVVADD